jgi:hypothetical protein
MDAPRGGSGGVSQGALAEPDKDGGDAEASRRGASAWARRPTASAMPLPLLLLIASSLLSKIRWRW